LFPQAELLASWKALKRKGRRSRVRQLEQADIFSGDEFKHGVGVAARRTIKTKSEKVLTGPQSKYTFAKLSQFFFAVLP
jgi:hypothetical protein